MPADKLGRTPLTGSFWNLGPYQWRSPKLQDLRDWCHKLCSRGANCNILVAYPYMDNCPGETWASFNRNVDLVPTKDACRISPLIFAICLRDYDLVAFLLQQGADVNFSDKLGRTPLMHAVRKNDVGMVRLLLNLNYCYKMDMWNFLQKRRLNKILSSKESGAVTISQIKRLPHASLKDCQPMHSPKTHVTLKDSENNQQLINHSTAPDDENATEKMPQAPFVGEPVVNSTENERELDDDDIKLMDIDVKSDGALKTSAVDLLRTDCHGWTVIHYLIRPFSCGTYDNTEMLDILADAGAPLNTSDTAGFSPLQMAVQSRAYRLASALRKLIDAPPENMPKGPVVEFTVKDNIQWDQEPWEYKTDAAAVLERVESEAMEEGEDDTLVVPDVHMEDIGEVVTDTEQNISFDVFMTKVDVTGGINGLYNFYKMQVISQQGKNMYILFTRWGKLGTEGDFQQTPHFSSEEAIRDFCRLFKAKSGNNWQDIKNFLPIPRKYRLVEALRRGRRKLRDIPLHLETDVPSKLPLPLQELMADLTRVSMYQEACQDIGIDTSVMPFGRLCEAALQRGRQILRELKNIVVEKIKCEGDPKLRDKATELAEKIIDHSSEYFQVIPQPGYVYEKVRPLENLQTIQHCMDNLEYMFNLELVSKMLLGAQLRVKDVNHLDYVYRAMNCQICAMQEDEIETQYILQYIYNTSLAPKPLVERIYKVSRNDEANCSQDSGQENRWLLWHGITVTKLISVFTRGISVGSPDSSANAQETGCKEICFTDSFEMSRRIYRPYSKPNRNTHYAILCEVSLGARQNDGNSSSAESWLEATKLAGTYFPDPACNIILSSGVVIPLGSMTCQYNSEGAPIHGQADYNEYIVNSREQVNIRYIVCYQCNEHANRPHKFTKVPTHS